MALIENTGGQGGRFLKILDGNIVERSNTEQPGYEIYNFEYPKGHEKAGEKGSYYIRRYAAVSGNFAGLTRKELPEHKIYGYDLTLSDEDGEFTIFFKDNSRITNRLLKTFENLALSKEIRIDVWRDRDGKAAIQFKQDDQNVPQHWNKDNLPQPEEIGGKWDFSEQDKFLFKHFRDEVIPNLPVVEKVKAAGAGAGAGSSSTTETVEDDPAPF
jgi:hypothetical protein